jgi:hypothetical protein
VTLPAVISACGDPGGGAALAPVLEHLARDGRVELRVRAYAQSLELLRARGIDAAPLGDDCAALLAPDVRLVLVATSHNGVDHERTLIASARAAGVRSLALLDFWSNYAARFSDASGGLTRVPDRIAVMDEVAKAGLVATGIDAARVVVTGHPGFDALAQRRKRFDAAARRRLRTHFHSDINGLQVLFVSQPLRAMYGAGRGSPGFLGYDEHLVLEHLIAALERLAAASGQPITLIVRPHPRESPDAFGALHASRVRVVVSREEDGSDVAMSSDVVAGMTSMLLVEALQLGCRVVSLQPGRLGPEVFPPDIAARMTVVTAVRDVEPALAEAAREADSAARGAAPGFSLARGGATQRVVDEVYAMVFGEDSQDGFES